MKHLSGFKMMALLLLGAGMAISCIDNSYDLDDVDYTLGVETDLTLPTCSTDTIYLRNFMDLKEDGVIQFVWDDNAKDSVFCVKQSGEANVDPIDIAEIRIKKPAISSFNTTVPLKNLIGGLQQVKRLRISIDTPFGPQTVDFEQEFEYVLDPQDARYAISPATANGISADIIRIDRVGINTLKATLQIHIIGFPDYIQKIHFDGLTLTYPDGIDVKECKFNNKGCKPKENAPAYELTPATDTEGMRISDDLLLELTFSGMEEGGAFTFDPAKHSATFQGDFSLTGTVRILTEDFEEEELKAELERIASMDISQLNQIIQNKDLTSLVPAEINIEGSAEMDKDIVLTTFSGSITHNVDRIDPIKLDDLPDFLNDEEVVLDLNNPLLLLNVNSQVTEQIATGLTLTSNTCPTPVVADNIKVNQGLNCYYMADNKASALPEGYEDATYLATTGSIPALIRKIPDQINVDVAPCTIEATDFDLTKTYDIDINYDVFAPLTFGENFLLVYKDTENDWAKDLDDLEDVNAECIELSGQIDNDLPAGFTFTIEPIDRNGKTIPQLVVDRISIEKSGKNQPFKVSIKAADGHTINDALAGKKGVQQLDGIRYTARLKGQEGQSLYRKAAIKIHDIKVSLKGEVTYDAN